MLDNRGPDNRGSTEVRTSGFFQNLLQELEQRKETLEFISEKIHPISLVLNPSDNKPLGSLMKQLKQNSKSLQAIETGLQVLSRTLSASGGGGKGGGGGGGGRGSIFRSFYSGKKDKVQDVKRNSDLEEGQVQDEPVFQDEEDSSDDDQDTPYARIDTLRKKILQGRGSCSGSSTLSPPTSQTGRPLSISGQVFNIPSAGQGKPSFSSSSSLKATELYERVEDVVPSPFFDYDMVCRELNCDHQPGLVRPLDSSQ